MVWIHGGFFLKGWSKTESFGPQFLLNHDVVLITFTYRLGLLGKWVLRLNEFACAILMNFFLRIYEKESIKGMNLI